MTSPGNNGSKTPKHATAQSLYGVIQTGPKPAGTKPGRR